MVVSKKKIKKRRKLLVSKKKAPQKTRLSLVVGLGGLLSIYLIELCNQKFLPLCQKLTVRDFLNVNGMSYIQLAVLFLSIWSIVFYWLSHLIAHDQLRGIKIFSIFGVLFFLMGSGVVSFLIQHKLNNYFIVFTFLASIITTKMFLDGILLINQWIRVEKKASNQVDVAKLTFIWAVVIALINLLKG